MNGRAREDRLRRQARRQGLTLEKSRVRATNLDNHGGYRLIDPDRNFIVAGERYDLDLAAVEMFLAAEQ